VADVLIRDFAAGDAAALDDLWLRVFGHPRGGQTVEWLFRPGPAGPCPRAVAEVDGRIVAHAGAMALRFRVGDAVVRGGYSVAAMTDPSFRGQHLFFRVGEHLYRRMEEEGFAFVAGFSNRNSFRLMTGPLRRTPIRPFPWCVRPLRPRRAAVRAAPPALAAAGAGDLRLVACEPTDPRLDEAWRRAEPDVRVGAIRDGAFSAWRFGTRADAGYRIVLAARGGRPAGYAVYRPLTLRGVRAGFVVDLVVAADDWRAGGALLRGLAGIARAEGALALSALQPVGGAARRALRRAGFVRVPERLHPQTIRFSVRGLGPWAGSTQLLDPRAWQVSWSDTDVV
jgi:hypothetical protein